MKSILDRYLDRVLVYANKPESESEAVRKELKDHLLQKVDDLAKNGLSREEATLEAIRQHGSPRVIGYGLRGPFPWIDIRSHGTARGGIAIGPKAVGVFAFGGVAVGVVACAPIAMGLISSGFFALGLFFAWGFFAIGGVATAFITFGIVALGFSSAGVVAQGEWVRAVWVPPSGSGGGVASYYDADNVPVFLRALEPLLHGCSFFDRYVFTIFLPVFLFGNLILGYLRYREAKRVASADDWLIDG